MRAIYPNQFFYPYTIYSPQQCVCQSYQSAINEQVAQMNMSARMQMLQLEQCMQSQIPYANLPSCAIYTPGGYYAGGGASGYIGNAGSGFCMTFNSLDSRMNEYCSKKESWIEKMDKLIFPNDPIRDWVENEVERISRKYAWTDQI